MPAHLRLLHLQSSQHPFVIHVNVPPLTLWWRALAVCGFEFEASLLAHGGERKMLVRASVSRPTIVT